LNRHLHKRIDLFSYTASKVSLFYGGYLLIFLSIYLLLISVGAFFHFLLSHNFPTIEDWAIRNGWSMIGLSKIVSLCLVVKWININTFSIHPMKKFIKEGAGNFIPSYLVVPLFLNCAVWYLSGASFTFAESFDFEFTIASFVGNLIFFFCDGFLFFYICYIYKPISRTDQLVSSVIFLLAFCIFSYITFPYKKPGHYFLILHMLTVVFISMAYKGKWGGALTYLSFVMAPLAPLYGLDPLWGNQYAIFATPNFPTASAVSILWVCIWVYIGFRSAPMAGLLTGMAGPKDNI